MIPTGSGAIVCPTVVGRDAELRLLKDALASARNGAGRVVCIVGEPGIGKSRLAREAHAYASDMAMMVLRGRSAPSSAPIPYRALGEALYPALEPKEPEIAALLPVLGSVIEGSNSSRSTEGSTLVVQDAVVRALGLFARDSGLLLVLEDLHWADMDTLSVIDHLSDNIADLPVLCVVTLRDDQGPALDLVARMSARRSAARMTLNRLDRDEVDEMVRRSLDVTQVTEDLGGSVQDRAEGVPFVVEEILTAYVAAGASERATLSLPHTYRDLVRERLDSVDPQTRNVLFAAAIIGRRFDWVLLSKITGLDRVDVLAALRIGVNKNIVSSDPAPGLEMPFGFRHALVREALVGELLPPEVHSLAGRAADAIEEAHAGLPGEWCERVADLRERAGDNAAAARHLQEAAQRCIVVGALGSAEAMLERARLLVMDDRWHRIGIDRQLVEALSSAGKVERLRQIADDALEFVIEKRTTLPFVVLGLGYLHLRLARGLSSAGAEVIADEHLERARLVATETKDERLLARVKVFEASRALARGDVVNALAIAADAADAAETFSLSDVRSEALSIQGHAALATGDTSKALTTFELARDEAGDDVVARVTALIDLGRIQAAISGDIAALESARHLAATSGAVSSEARAEILMAGSLVERFALAEAQPLVSHAMQTARRFGLAMHADARSVDAERRALLPIDTDAKVAVSELNEPSRAHLVLALRLVDPVAARHAAESLSDPIARGVSDLMSSLEGTRPHAHSNSSRLGAALMRAGESSMQDSIDALAPFPWWRHVVVRLLLDKDISAGRTTDAPLLGECLRFFEAAGHERLTSACRAMMRAAGLPVPRKGRGDSAVPQMLSRAGVTSREMDVLRLVARGLGNVEIAAQLFVSRRTVESHVASLQRKLQASNRMELA
ncbi:MAG: AAA family ATPase, partial [Actinobacteria bacterium]|nr:AAA family ATPase [Actinomycetota bacterium]